jgi:hypothetical protein
MAKASKSRKKTPKKGSKKTAKKGVVKNRGGKQSTIQKVKSRKKGKK